MYNQTRRDYREIDYSKYNVAPPTRETHEEPEPLNVGGEWKQKGNYIYREGAEIRSASKIPSDRILKGTDDEGKPILEKITIN